MVNFWVSVNIYINIHHLNESQRWIFTRYINLCVYWNIDKIKQCKPMHETATLVYHMRACIATTAPNGGSIYVIFECVHVSCL